MKTPLRICLFILLVACASCSRENRSDGTSQARRLASAGATALNAGDYLRAQSLSAQATRVQPDFAEGWVGYGMASARLGQPERAREAYERALSIHKARYEQNPSDANQLCQQVMVLTLLGRTAEAETLLEGARAAHADDPQYATFAAHYAETKKAWKAFAVSGK